MTSPLKENNQQAPTPLLPLEDITNVSEIYINMIFDMSYLELNFYISITDFSNFNKKVK